MSEEINFEVNTGNGWERTEPAQVTVKKWRIYFDGEYFEIDATGHEEAAILAKVDRANKGQSWFINKVEEVDGHGNVKRTVYKV